MNRLSRISYRSSEKISAAKLFCRILYLSIKVMKKVLLCLMMIVGFCLINCKKEKVNVREILIGKWTHIKEGWQSPIGSAETFNISPEGSYVEFKADGTYIQNFNGNILTTTWELNTNDNKIQLVGFTNNYTIVKLTQTELIYYFDEIYDQNGNQMKVTNYQSR